MVYVALKPIHYGATTKVWTVGISSLDHSHALVANPLSYAVHLKVLPEHQLALAAAVSHRFAVISWSASNRILDHLGLGLTRTQYYNVLRNTPLQKGSWRRLTRLASSFGQDWSHNR